MALFKSNILAQASGSINGMTFSRNKGGAYIRGRGIPSNPGTDRQDQVRTAMASISKAWATTLTQAQRDLWNGYGANTKVINRLGDTVRLSGIAAFNSVNLFRMASLALPMVEIPPDPVGGIEAAPAFTSAVLNQPEGSPPVLSLTLSAPSVEYGVVVYYSGPLSPGIKYFRGPYIARVMAIGVETGPVIASLSTYGEEPTSASIGMKVTLYRLDNKQPIWTVNIDPLTVTGP